LASGGDALPWTNPQRFAERCIALAIEHLKASENETRAFFDRSLIDAVSALQHMNLSVPDTARRALETQPYARRVFMAAPWPELFATDAERRHTFDDSKAEYERLLVSYGKFGHETVLIPKQPVEQRADFILGAIEKN
jgi:predicted ATPase